MAQGRSTKSIWIRTSRLSIKSSLSGRYGVRCRLFNVGALRRQKMKKQIHAWNLSHLNDERANPSLESEPCLVWQRKNCFRPWQIRTRSIFFRFPVSWLAHSDLRAGGRYGAVQALQCGCVPPPNDERANPSHFSSGRGRFACASQEIGHRKPWIWSDSRGLETAPPP